MNVKIMSNIKPVISVSEMAQILNLSRTRLYQLINDNILPMPAYDIRSHRPIYTAELQEICLNIRQTGIGYNGQYILFYSPRKIKNTSNKNAKKNKNKVDPIIEEYKETLESMGLVVSSMQIKNALAKIYPDGYEDNNEGLIIRELFRFLKFEV